MRSRHVVSFLFAIGLAISLYSAAFAQDPPSTRFTGDITTTVCSGSSYDFGVGVQNNILAGQSTITYFYAGGVLQPNGTFIENGPYTSYNPSYHVGPGEAFAYAAGTIVASRIESYDGPGGTGDLKYISFMEWVCDTGTVLTLDNQAVGGGEVVEPVPGCDVLVAIPDTAVGATIGADTPVYWAPGKVSDETFPAGLNVRAIGVDASGAYTKVLFVCGYYWVPSSVIGPNYDAPWNGAPLPTGVVE